MNSRKYIFGWRRKRAKKAGAEGDMGIHTRIWKNDNRK